MKTKRFRFLSLLLALALIGGLCAAAAEEKDAITFPYTGEPIVLRGLWCNHNNRIEDTLAYNEYLKRIGNITIEWEQSTWADYEQKINLYYTSGNVPDFAVCGSPVGTASQYGPSGIFLDYAKYADYMPNFQAMTEKYPNLNMTMDAEGHRYVIPTSIDGILTDDWAMLSWFCNKGLLDKHGIAVPKTLEEFVAAAKELKEKEPDCVPIIMGNELGDLSSSVSSLYGTDYLGLGYDFSANKWYYAPTDDTETCRAVLETCNDLWKSELLNPELATDTVERTQQKMLVNNWGFFYGYISYFQENFYSKGVEPGWVIEPMLPPSVNGVSSLPYTQTFDGDPWWGVVTGSKTKYPELVCALIDFTLSDEISELLNWGVKGETYTENADGVKDYLPDVAVPGHPEGTKTLRDLGIGQYNHILFRQSDLRAGMLQLYGQKEMEWQAFIDEAIADGRITPMYRARSPHFTAEEQDIISTIMTPVETYADEEMLKFIMGERDMSEFDAFIQNLPTMGDVNRAIEMYNEKPAFELAPRK